MSLPPVYIPKPRPVEVPISNGRVIVTTKGGIYDREPPASTGMRRDGDHFTLQFVMPDGGVIDVRFTYDALADHRDRINGMLA